MMAGYPATYPAVYPTLIHDTPGTAKAGVMPEAFVRAGVPAVAGSRAGNVTVAKAVGRS